MPAAPESLVPAAERSWRLRCPGGGRGGLEGLSSPLCRHTLVPPGEALLRAKISQGTPGNLISTAFSNAGGVTRRKEAPPGLPWPPQLVAKVIRHSLLARCSRLSPPLSLPIILTSACWFGLRGFSPSALTGTAGHGLENEGREGVPHSGLPVE